MFICSRLYPISYWNALRTETQNTKFKEYMYWEDVPFLHLGFVYSGEKSGYHGDSLETWHPCPHSWQPRRQKRFQA